MVNQNNSATNNEYIVDFAWAGLSLYCDGMKTMLTNALASKALENRMLSYGVTAKFTVLGNLDNRSV